MKTVRPRSATGPVVPPTRPMLVAHRGASATVAEHTLAAYQEAIALGADALECDVRLTRDGHLVCVHDRTVDRTSDGRGVVSDLALAELETLDFASWRTSAAASEPGPLEDSAYNAGVEPDRIEQGGGVLRLDMLLELVHDADRQVRLLIETKHPTRYGGLVEKTLIEELTRFGWAGRPGPPRSLRAPADLDNRVVVMSFASTAIRRIRLLAPDVPTVKLLDRLSPQRRAGQLAPGAQVAGPSIELLRTYPDYVSLAHRLGHPVYAWTVNERSDVLLARELGVDAVITDRPREVAALLDGEELLSRHPARGKTNEDSLNSRGVSAERATGMVAPRRDVDIGTAAVRHEPASAGLVRRLIRDDLAAHGVQSEDIDDVVLVASELVGNAVRHAPAIDHDELGVEWHVDGGSVTVFVRDGSTRPPEIRDTNTTNTSGRGLAIVAALCSDWGVQPNRHGKQVWARVPVAGGH